MKRERPTDADATPGTGVQYYVEASPPCGCRGELESDECGDINHEHPNTYVLEGQRWKVGHDYLDCELGCVAELTSVHRKSSWCDVGDAENGTLEFRFQSPRRGQYTVRPARSKQMSQMNLEDRFIERYRSPQTNPSAPAPPW